MNSNNTAYLFTGLILLSPISTFAANPYINGFLDVTHLLSDGETDGTSARENKFNTSAELDLQTALTEKASVRIDVDYQNTVNEGTGVSMEQAFLRWKAQGGLNVLAGVMNNPLGWEGHDAPDLYQISQGQLWNIFDGQTSLYANNIAGLMVEGKAGNGLEFAGGVLNDLGNVAEENSLIGLARFKGTPDLELELGVITQDSQAETLIDANATFKRGALTVGGEALIASAVYDIGLGATASYQVSDDVSATLRFDTVSYEASGIDDTSSITVAGSMSLSKNVVANVEVRINDNGETPAANPAATVGDGELIMLELIATF